MSEKQIQTVRGECEWRRVREAKTTTASTTKAATTTAKQQSYESFCRAPDAGVAAAATAAETATAAGYRHH